MKDYAAVASKYWFQATLYSIKKSPYLSIREIFALLDKQSYTKFINKKEEQPNSNENTTESPQTNEEDQNTSDLNEEFNMVPVSKGRLALFHQLSNRYFLKLLGVGCTHVCTLLSENENAQEMEKLVKKNGLQWIWLPLSNGDIPQVNDFGKILIGLKQLSEIIESGGSLLIHCSAGIHRTGMIANVLLRYLGLSESESLKIIHEARTITHDQVGKKRLKLGNIFTELYGTYHSQK